MFRFPEIHDYGIGAGPYRRVTVVMEEPKGYIYREDIAIPLASGPGDVARLLSRVLAKIADAAQDRTPTHQEGAEWEATL